MGNTEARGGSHHAQPAHPGTPLVVSRDLRSIRVEQLLREKWRLYVKKLPPAGRVKWLSSQEGIVALGARQCNQLLKELGRAASRWS